MTVNTGSLFSSDIYGVNRYWVADQFGGKGCPPGFCSLSAHQRYGRLYKGRQAGGRELYTGHNRIGVGSDYLMVWEQCPQNLVNYGPDSVSDDRREDGAILAKDGNSFNTL